MVKPDNYIMIPGWMRTELDLKGNELNLYAIIYGFTQDGETEFSGSIRYMQEWLGAESKQTVFNTLEKLIKRGLVQKRTEVLNGVRHNYYLASPRGSPKIRPPSPNFRPGVVQNLDHPSPNFRPNNIEDNITDILVILTPDLQRWRELFSTEMMLLAISEGAKNGAHKWSYIESILRRWKKNNIKTPGDFEAWEAQRKPSAGQQPKRSTAEDYDEIFRELLGGST